LGKEPPEADLLDRALGTLGMSKKDVCMRPDLSGSDFVFGLFSRWMKDPLSAPAEAQGSAREILRAADRPSRFLASLAAPADLAPAMPRPPTVLIRYPLPLHLPDPLDRAVRILLDALGRAHEWLTPLTENLHPGEAALLEKYLYPSGVPGMVEDQDSEDLFRTEEARQALAAAEKTDRKAILRAGLVLAEALERAADLLQREGTLLADFPSLSFMTPIGRVVIGGTGPDIHEGEAALVLDLGGDDLYRGPVASGRDGKCSLVLDLRGNDSYIGGDLSQGAGLRGIGILWDMGGDDLYSAGRCSQGAGIFGIGLLLDGGGSDTYLGESFTQAASLWGWGGLADLGGEDVYLCRKAGQAYAEVLGVSCLADLSGNDRYLAGRKTPDRREPGMNQSMAQGFAVGMRNLTGGGFALLADATGNDHYQCQYFGQGASYWMGVGVLYDERGKDTYVARRYAQGAGIHYSLGMLLDADGDDHTVSWAVSQGCGHDCGVGLLINESGQDTYFSDWLCLGASEANGIGLFVDNGGDDGYDNKSGMGVGHLTKSRRSGGLGIFLDAGGKDRYSSPGGNGRTWGSTPWGVGIDGEQRVSSSPHLALPESPPKKPEPARLEKEEEKARLLKQMDRAQQAPLPEKVQRLLAVASHWGHERELPEEAKEELLELPGRESSPVMVNLLDTPDVLSLLFMDRFFMVHAFQSLSFLRKKLESAGPLLASRILFQLGRLRDSKDVASCLSFLDHPSWKVRAQAIRALGQTLEKKRLRDLLPMREAFIKARTCKSPKPIDTYLLKKGNPAKALSVLARAVPLDYRTYKRFEKGPVTGEGKKYYRDCAGLLFRHSERVISTLESWIESIENSDPIGKRIAHYLGDPDPAIRKAAVYALGQMEYSPALPGIIHTLYDTDRWVRDAAVLSLARFGDSAVDLLASALKKSSRPSSRILLLRALGRIKGPRVEEAIRPYLEDPHPGVRRAAESALDKQGRQ